MFYIIYYINSIYYKNYKYMLNHDNLILKTIFHGKRPSKRFFNNLYKYPNIVNYLNNRFEYTSNIRESLDRIKLHIETRPVCKYCGKPVLYRRYNEFATFCSLSCSNKYNVNKVKETCLKKYGVTNGGWIKSSQEKIKQTNLKRYGVLYHSQLDSFKEKMSIIMSSKEIQNKMNKTKLKNKSFNISKQEEKIYLYLKEKFQIVKRQYFDKLRYPYNCDFYIPDLDLFIECNFHWTHGFHPFNVNSIEDINMLNKWRNKNTNYYNNAIKTWAERDVEKRNKAIENKLNFKEFYNFNEAKEYIKTLK